MEERVDGERGGAPMKDQETQFQVQVRTLTGDSITLSISPDKTVHDLKLLLLERFSPAISSPNFHLFLRGVKLGLKTQVASQLINSDEFLVLVPFTKKCGSKTKSLNPSQSTPSSFQVPLTDSALNLAQSVWSEMMGDFWSLCSTLGNEEGNIASLANDLGSDLKERDCGSDIVGRTAMSRKRKKQSNENKEDSSVSDEVISTILQSISKTIMDDDVCQGFVRVLESVNCFSDVQSGKCMILGNVNLQLSGEKLVSCARPSWLKVLMKAFAFLNIFSGCMLAQLKKVTMDNLTDALDKIRKLGLDVSMEDLNHLSVLCPKVVSFFNHEAESSKPDNMVITINLLREEDGHAVIIERRTPLSRIIDILKKRESFFRKKST